MVQSRTLNDRLKGLFTYTFHFWRFSESITRRYLDLLTDAFMIRQLQPYHVNMRKRQVKAPKICVRDSGLLLYQLLGIQTPKELLSHPKGLLGRLCHRAGTVDGTP